MTLLIFLIMCLFLYKEFIVLGIIIAGLLGGNLLIIPIGLIIYLCLFLVEKYLLR